MGLLLPPCPGDAEASDISHAGKDASKASGLLILHQTGYGFAFLKQNELWQEEEMR